MSAGYLRTVLPIVASPYTEAFSLAEKTLIYFLTKEGYVVKLGFPTRRWTASNRHLRFSAEGSRLTIELYTEDDSHAGDDGEEYFISGRWNTIAAVVPIPAGPKAFLELLRETKVDYLFDAHKEINNF